MHPKLVLNLLHSQSWPWILIFFCLTLECWDHKHVPPFQIYMGRTKTESMLGKHSATCHISSAHKCAHTWVHVVSVHKFVYPCTCGHEGMWRAEANVRQVVFNLHLRFWGWVSDWTQSSLTQLSWTDSYLPSPSPRSGVTDMRHGTQLFVWVLGRKLGSSCTFNKDFTNSHLSNITPAPAPKGSLKVKGESLSRRNEGTCHAAGLEIEGLQAGDCKDSSSGESQGHGLERWPCQHSLWLSVEAVPDLWVVEL